MGYLSGRSARADSWGDALDDRWYAPMQIPSDSGLAISAETTLACGTVLAALRFKAESFAMCAPKVLVELPGDKKKADRQHYLFKTLRKPNRWQTGFTWRALQQIHLGLWGNAYSRIVEGPRSFAQELRPIHPTQIKPIDQVASGELVYELKGKLGEQPTRLSQDKVLHFRGLSIDGFSGVVTYQLIRNVVGIALAAEKHAAVFLKKGTRLSGILTTKEPMTPEVQDRAEKSWARNFGGPDAEGAVALVGAGLDFKPISIDHRNAQFLELRDFQVQEILRFLGVPGVVVGYADKTATYASADAFFEKGGIKHCLLPSVINMEEEIDYALIPEDDEHYCKFSLDVLLRANTKDRYETLVKATGRPFLTGNEARRVEDLNPIEDDPSMDRVLMPSNMAGTTDTQADDPQPPPNAPPVPEPDDSTDQRRPPVRPRAALSAPSPAEDDAAQSRVAQFAVDAAARVIRREVAAIRGGGGRLGAAARHASKPDAWREWAARFYEEHADFVAEALHVPPEAAKAYADGQRDELLAAGVGVVEGWEAAKLPALVDMALGDA